MGQLITVREMFEEDQEVLKEIYFNIRQEEFPWVDQQSIRKDDFLSSTQGECILVAVIKGEVVGYVSVWEPDRFIHQLFVKKAYRRAGVGRALLDQVAKIWGVPLTLKCVKANQNAVDFYLLGGWEIVKEEAGPEGPYYLMKYENEDNQKSFEVGQTYEVSLDRDNVYSSERLNFKRMTKNDFSTLCQMLKDPDVMYAWEHDFTDEDVEAWIEKRCALYDLMGYDYFLAIDKQTQEVVGQIGLLDERVNGEHFTGIGYILKKEFWHKGFATEGAKAMIAYAFNELGKEKIIATIRPENATSCKVAKRLGMKIESEFVKVHNGKDMVHLVYSLLREDYEKDLL